MNKQEYLEWRAQKRRILGDRRLTSLSILFMFVGFAFAFVLPPPFNSAVLIVGYVASLLMMIAVPEIAFRGQTEASAFVRRAVDAYQE